MPLDGTNYTDTLTDTEKAARGDLWLWLDRFPARVPALLEAVREGHVDGSIYYGRCRCVIGTLHHDHACVTYPVLSDDSLRRGYISDFCETTPIEHFVEEVEPGDTPANCHELALVQEWIMQWQAA